VEVIAQAGREKIAVAADPDGTGPGQPIVRERRYDLWGRVVATRVGAEPWTCSTFDARGRPVTTVYPAFGGSPARTVTHTHAVAGNPLVSSVSDPAGTITTIVDLLGRVVSYTDVWDKTTTTGYDQLGRVTQTAGPAGTLAYTYDPAGRVETVRLDGDLLADPSYDTAGELAGVSYPGGVGNAGNGTNLGGLATDPAGRPVGLAWALQGSTVTDTVVRDQAGRVVEETLDGVDHGPGVPNFVYDGAGRLTSALVPGHAYTYGYGPAGCGTLTDAGKNTNRTSMTDNATTTSYCYDHADRLTSTTASGYTGTIAYDAHGNTTTIAGETRGYDTADRHLTTTKAATTITYTRDALDRIVARTDGTTTIKYAYSASGDSADATLDASGAVIEQTIGLPGGALVTKRSAGDVWSYPNLHGDIIATANASGTKQGPTLHWGPYGETLTTIPDNSAHAMDYGWLGQHQRPLEHQTNLVGTIEMGARQYDPTLGRFLQTDPIEGGSCNDYDYVCADPINQYDFDGLRCWTGKNKNGSCRSLARGAGRAARTVGRSASRVATGAYRRVGFTAQGCAAFCLGVEYRHGHLYLNYGGGPAFGGGVGPTINFWNAPTSPGGGPCRRQLRTHQVLAGPVSVSGTRGHGIAQLSGGPGMAYGWSIMCQRRLR
jgi:RHS repeat-associated protein